MKKTLAQHLKQISMNLDFAQDEINHAIQDDMDSRDVIWDELHMTFNDGYLMGQISVLLELAETAKRMDGSRLIYKGSTQL